MFWYFYRAIDLNIETLFVMQIFKYIQNIEIHVENKLTIYPQI